MSILVTVTKAKSFILTSISLAKRYHFSLLILNTFLGELALISVWILVTILVMAQIFTLGIAIIAIIIQTRSLNPLVVNMGETLLED